MDVVAAQTKAIAGNLYLLLYYLSRLYGTGICSFNIGFRMKMLFYSFFTLNSKNHGGRVGVFFLNRTQK